MSDDCGTRAEGFTARRSTWLLAVVAAVLLLVASGVAYRVVGGKLHLVADTRVALEKPLSFFPMNVANWRGQDVPIPANIQAVADNDDFLNRLYVSTADGRWVNLYIAYTATPRTMLGHNPQECYVGGGWIHDGTEQSTITSWTGDKISCLLHRFHMLSPSYEERIVLNYYVINGEITSSEEGFSGVGWRSPNIRGRPASYVAQVQISSVVESSVRAAAAEMTDLIRGFFPSSADVGDGADSPEAGGLERSGARQ